MTKKQKLAEIANRIKKCKKCSLYKSCLHAVPGEGNPNAKIMFIGEAPGEEESRQGRPFVGAAGKFLDELIKKAGFRRKDIFITNVVKCRPPANRDPLPQEIETCWGYLETQIEIIKPKLIVTLGRHAMYKFLPERLKISHDHGKVFKMVEKKTGRCQVYYPVYHPAAALYQGGLKAVLEKDFRKIPKILEKLINTKNQLN